MHTVQFTKGLKRNKETKEGRIWLFLSDCLSRDLNLWLFSKFMVLRISDSDCNLHHHLLWFSGLQTLCTPISFPGAPIYRVEIMGLLSFHNCMSFSYIKFLLICISIWIDTYKTYIEIDIKICIEYILIYRIYIHIQSIHIIINIEIDKVIYVNIYTYIYAILLLL